MAYNEFVMCQGNRTNNWQFYKMNFMYLLGFDEKLFNRPTVLNVVNGPLVRETSRLVLYQGHHNDFNTRCGDLILPVRTFFETAAFYLNMWGQLQRSSKIILTAKRKKISTDSTVMRMVMFMLTGVMYKQCFAVKNIIKKVGMKLYVGSWRVNIRKSLLRVVGASCTDSLYYLDNSMVRNSNVMAVASSYYEGDAWWLLF